MDIKDLLLKSEELPILDQTCFQVPIYPKLLEGFVEIPNDLAIKSFQRAKQSWCTEINLKFPRGWNNLYKTNENGLVVGFQISRDCGGGLYFDKDDYGCRDFGGRYIRFSPEKKSEFETRMGIIYTYAMDNIDDYRGALFLRNWAMHYMNLAIKDYNSKNPGLAFISENYLIHRFR